jgi:hypothetical protein
VKRTVKRKVEESAAGRPWAARLTAYLVAVAALLMASALPLGVGPPSDRDKAKVAEVAPAAHHAPDPPPEAERYEWPEVYDRWSDMVEGQVLNPDDVVGNREPVNYVDVMEWGTETEDGEEIPWVKPAESEYYHYNLPHEATGFPGVAEPSYPFPFIVITNEKWWYGEGQGDYEDQGDVEGKLQDFWNWKMRKGEPLHIVMVDDIVAHWEGSDKQDKIRNWMKALVNVYATENFLLAGDTAAPTGSYEQKWAEWGRYGVVPSRCLCGYTSSDKGLSDLYYTCLEGSWGPLTVGGVGYWGIEGARATFHPTVYVGRVPIGDVDPPEQPNVPTQAEIETENYCAKLINYEKDPPSGYVNDVLLVGADFSIAYNHCTELKNKYFSSWSTTEVYEPQVRYPNYPRPHDVYDALADGPAISFVGTHGHPLCYYILTHGTGFGPGVYIQEFATDEGIPVSNDMVFAHGLKKVNAGNKYGLQFGYACSTFKYDWRNLESEECLGEEFLCDDYGGGVTYIGNTIPAGTSCFTLAKDYLFDYLLNKGMYDVGRAVAKSRTDYIKASKDYDQGYMLNLGGDPTMELWTSEPVSLSMTYNWSQHGVLKYLEVHVKDSANNDVEGATVCLWQQLYYLIVETGDGGKCSFKDLLFGFDDGKLTATKHNYKPALLDNVTIGSD